MPVAVIADESPELTVEGLATQLTVGGSNGFTTYGAVQSALSPGLDALRDVTLQGVRAGSCFPGVDIRRA
jgi:hypothetical protein